MSLMSKIHRWIDRSPPVLWVIFFLICATGLTYFRVAPYGGRVSALISMQKEFLDANPTAGFTGMVVLRDSGYDGQFFYLTARYLFDPGMPKPTMDTYTMRMGRIGMGLLSGIGPAALGWHFYPVLTLLLLHLFHILSFFALRGMLSSDRKSLALIFLFSPFSLNSTLLLVSDSLVVSTAIIGLYVLERAGFRLSPDTGDRTDFRSLNIWGAASIFCFTVLVRETGLFFLAPLGLLFLYRRRLPGIILIAFPVIIYALWTAYVKLSEVNPGTNPINYGERLALPFQGMVESLFFSGKLTLKILSRDASTLLNIIFLALLLYSLRGIRSVTGLILALPIVLVALLSIFAVKEYWNTFDNISRMFAMSLPWAILLRDRLSGYHPRGVFAFSVFLFLLLCVRMIWLKTAMPFDVIG